MNNTWIHTYDPLLHLFPENLKLLELDLSWVIHLVYCQGELSLSIIIINIIIIIIIITIIIICFTGWTRWTKSREWVSDVEGYVHQVDDAVAGAESQTVKFNFPSWRSNRWQTTEHHQQINSVTCRENSRYLLT